jgi:hypothetical protein
MTPRTEPLGPDHSEPLRALLTQDTPHNLYLLGLFEEFGLSPVGEAQGTYYGHFEGDALKAALFVGGTGGLLVPSASTGREIGALAQELASKIRLQSALGEKSSVDALVRALNVRPTHLAEQRLFVVSADDLGPFTNPTLRLATDKDLPQLLEMAAEAVCEATGSTRVEDPEFFNTRVNHRVRSQRTYVLEVEGKLVFKLDIGSRSQYGADLEGIYTIPSQRRMGHATLSLGQISRHLLSSLPRLTLRVNEDNTVLARIAQRVGYVAKRTMSTVIA